MAEKLQLEDFLNYSMLSGIQYSSDGKKFSFLVKRADTENNSYHSDLWVSDEKGMRRMTGYGAVGLTFWEDDTHIVFTSRRDEEDNNLAKRQIINTSFYRLDLDGGEAVKYFKLPIAVSSVSKLGSDQIVLRAVVDVEYPEYYKMDDAQKEEVGRKKNEEKDYEILDEIPFWNNGKGITNKKRDGLFLYTLSTGELVRITSPAMSVRNYVICGGNVVYSGYDYETKWNPHQPIYRYLTAESVTETVYDKEEYRFRDMGAFGSKVVIKSLKMDLGYPSACMGHFSVIDLDKHEVLPFSDNEFRVGSSVGSDCRLGGGTVMKEYDGKLYFIATIRDSAMLCRFTEDGSFEIVLEKDGSMDSFDINPCTGEITAVCFYDNRLQELYRISPGTKECRRISDFNTKILEDKYVAEYQQLNFMSAGKDIDGFVLLPKDYDESKSYPAILDIHGGPITAYGKIFYHEMQYWANEGFFVFFCNPSGSDGRGLDFSNVYGKMGEDDYENLMDFTDAVMKKYPQIDASRIGVTGGSYGGLMTNWIIGHTNRFACAAAQRSISNWFSYYGMADIGFWAGWDHTGVDMYTDPKRVWEASPLKYADQVKTPTLFVHSTEDYRCPISEAVQMMTAIADRGVPTRLCVIKGENHELSRSGKPAHRVRRLKELTDWMKKYLM